jgi:Siphovirus Gp157
MAKRLFDLSDDLLKLEALLTETGGEFSDDEAGKALEAFFEQTHLDVATKVDGYCALIREFELRGDAREEEAKRLSALAATDYNAADRLRKRLKTFLEIHKIAKLDTPRFRISIRANGGKLPLIVPDAWEKDPSAAPERFHRKTISLDKDAIRTALTDFYEKAMTTLETFEEGTQGDRSDELWRWLDTPAGEAVRLKVVELWRTIKSPEDRRAALAEWLESDEGRALREPIAKCGFGPRGTSLQIK